VNCQEQNVIIELGDDLNAKQKVFNYMLNNCAQWNRIVTKQGIMAEELKLTRQTINRTLKTLEGSEYIARDGKEQQNIVYMIDPSKNWKGKEKDHDGAINKFNRLIGKMSHDSEQDYVDLDQPKQTPKSLTIKKQKGIDDTLTIKEMIAMRPYQVDDELWEAAIKARKKRKAGQTDRSLKGFVRSLAECVDAGHSGDKVLEIYLEETWKGLKLEWVENKLSSGESKAGLDREITWDPGEYEKLTGKSPSIDADYEVI
jgi:DNA-binding Lrp family transcriptional regulator